jgi:hypothetical protein
MLDATEAAAIALEKYGPGWVAQDATGEWYHYRLEPGAYHDELWSDQEGDMTHLGNSHPNPEWRSSKMRIDHPPKGTTCDPS